MGTPSSRRAPAFIGLSPQEAEELAVRLGLHPCVLDGDVLKELVALGFSPAPG